jgi:hypothetical protein
MHRHAWRPARILRRHRIRSGGIDDIQADPVVLADLEHVLRVSRHPVRIRAAEREREPHLPDAGRGDGRGARAVDRGTADRPDRSAHRGLPVGSHLDRTGPAPSLLPRGRGAVDAGAVRDAQLAGVVDCRRHAVDPRRLAQHLDGTVPCLRRRPTGAATAPHRLRDAEFLHRRGLGGGEPAAVVVGQGRRRQHRRRWRDPGHGALRLLFRWRGAAAGNRMDRAAHAGVSARAVACLRRCAAGRRRTGCARPSGSTIARAGPCLAVAGVGGIAA